MKRLRVLHGHLILILLFSFSIDLSGQVASATPPQKKSTLSIELNGGYDYPLFNYPYKEFKYNGGLNAGAVVDFRLPFRLGVRASYSYIRTNPEILIADTVIYFPGPPPIRDIITKSTKKLIRHFVGLGPTYDFGSDKFRIGVGVLGGYSWLNGGDAYAENSFFRPHLINTGYNTGVWSGKGEVDFSYAFNDRLSMRLGLYYLRHFDVPVDVVLDVSPGGTWPIQHGELVLTDHEIYDIPQPPPLIENHDAKKDLASVGVTLGVRYTFGFGKKDTGGDKGTDDVEPPAPPIFKVAVTVQDEISGKTIPGAEVALKNSAGNIVNTGITNSFGAIEFDNLDADSYTVIGSILGIETTMSNIPKSSFGANPTVQSKIFYNDLRFILNGKVINQNTRAGEPNVLVSLTNSKIGSVEQDNSNGKGEFSFRLDRDADYEIVGKKENRLSNIERSSTVGLKRSTTLFVDLELGVENFDCGIETKLDIKYRTADHFLDASAKFELDKLIRYMKDHQSARVELSSHTDCVGNAEYNQKLSERRAETAVEYITSKGISRGRIIAQGFGETRSKNGCDISGGCSKCTDSEKAENRRTEAKLLCN